MNKRSHRRPWVRQLLVAVLGIPILCCLVTVAVVPLVSPDRESKDSSRDQGASARRDRGHGRRPGQLPPFDGTGENPAPDGDKPAELHLDLLPVPENGALSHLPESPRGADDGPRFPGEAIPASRPKAGSQARNRPGEKPSLEGPARAEHARTGLQDKDAEDIPKPPTALPKAKLPPVKPDTQGAALLGAARLSMRRGDLELAQDRFQEYLGRYPDDLAVRQEYAGVLIQAGRLRQAADQYDRLVTLNPDDADLRVALADIYLQAKEFKKAVPPLTKALELSKGDLEIAAKLARVHAFDNDLTQATQMFERYLARIRPADERAPRSLGPLLIDLGRYREALPYFLQLREKVPEDLEVLGNLARNYYLLGDRSKAAGTVKEMEAINPSALTERLQAAEALFDAQAFDLAESVYGQILRAQSGNETALVGLAKIHLQLFQPRQACALLGSFVPTPALERIVLLTWAEYHQRVGEYGEAKQIYKDLIRKNENDNEARQALGALYEFIREYEKAKAEYAKVLVTSPSGRKARIGYASTLAAQRRFAEAIDIYKVLLGEDSHNAAAMAQLARALGKDGRADKAATLSQAFLSLAPHTEANIIAVRLALGRVYLEACRNAEAAAEFQVVLSYPSGQVPEAYYGRARAQEKMGNAGKAAEVLLSCTSYVGGDARNRLLLADLFYTDYDDARAVAMSQAVLKWDPENLSALIRLGDAQLRLANLSGNVQEVLDTYKKILSLSPTNTRGHLGVARALSVAQDYKAAIDAYDRFLAIDRDFTIPMREKARVLYSDNQFLASEMAYQRMWVPSADEQLHDELEALAQRDPHISQALASYLKAGLNGKVLQAEVGKIVHASANPDYQAAFQRILIDYNARSADQTAAYQEGLAKSRKDWRNYEAIPLYKSLIALEPANEVAVYDLGQVYSALRQTRNALAEYAHLLQVDPPNREGAICLDRASLELNPRLTLGMDYFYQNGRDFLALIERTHYTAFVTLPIGDENEFFGVGYSRALLVPQTADTLSGNIVSVRYQKKCCDARLLLYTQANYEQYENRFNDRVTYDAGTIYDICDLMRFHLTSFLENVAENGETLQQDIYRLGLNTGPDFHVTRFWNFGGNYRYAHYSDENDMHEMFLYNEVSLTLPPKQLKLAVTTDYQSFADGTERVNANPSILAGAIHPYFAPGSFDYTEGRIEWWHWISRDYSNHTNVCWYSLQYGVGWDSQFAQYNVMRALFNYDVRSWLTIGADARVMLSPVYDATSAMGYVIVRSPYPEK